MDFDPDFETSVIDFFSRCKHLNLDGFEKSDDRRFLRLLSLIPGLFVDNSVRGKHSSNLLINEETINLT